MTRSISRKFYQRFLWLYPEPFRHEFGNEMLALFEQCQAAQGTLRLLADVILSAARQQIHYQASPAPASAPLYSEITSSSHLARTLALAVFSAAMILGAVAGHKPAADRWTAVSPPALFWFPVGTGCDCSGTPVTGVLVGRDPAHSDSWTVVRQSCAFAARQVVTP